MTLDQAPQSLWTTEWDSTEWPARVRVAAFLSAALGSWAVILGVGYLLWQAL